MLLRELIGSFEARFAEAGIESAQADAELLIADILGVARGELLAMALTDGRIDGPQLIRAEELAARRVAREPLQHLTGKAYFRNLTLSVGPGVFVPRPETELLAGLGVAALGGVFAGLVHEDSSETDAEPNSAEPNAAEPGQIAIDLATGSGVIALAMATEAAGSRVFAVELSEDAIAWTSKNFAAYREAIEAAGGSIELRQGDLRDAFQDLNGTATVVLSNPPYIPVDMVPIYPEVVLHDPELALYGGQDGLDLVRGASLSALRLLKSGGFFAVEHADIQGPDVCALLVADGWTSVTQHQDFNGRDRVVSAIKP